MGYREAIKKGMGYEDSEVDEACVNILTETDEYPLSFIQFETKDFLGIQTTREDFTEGFVVLNKKYIVSIAIVYKNDIIIKESEEENVSYN